MRASKLGLSSIVAIGLLTGAAVGVAAQDEADPMDAAWVTGVIRWASSCESPIYTAEEGLIEERGHRCAPRTVTSDDPRIGGTSAVTWNKDVHVFDGPRRGIRSVTEDIRGDGGGWVCHTRAVLDDGDGFFATSIQGSELSTCVGDGDNEGLTALLVFTTTDGQDAFEGLIFPGDLPPVPEATGAE